MIHNVNLSSSKKTRVIIGSLLVLLGVLHFYNFPSQTISVFDKSVSSVFFFAFGVIIILHSYTAKIDLSKKIIFINKKLNLFQKPQSLSIKKIEYLTLEKYKDEYSDSNRTRYRLITNSKDIIFENYPYKFAWATAKNIAKILKVNLTNRVFRKPFTRSFQDLEKPFVKFHKNKLDYKTKSNQFGSNYVQTESTPQKMMICYKAHFDELTRMVSPIILASVLAITYFSFEYIPIFIFLVIFTCILVEISLSFYGKSKIAINNKFITYRQGFSLTRSKVQIQNIIELIPTNEFLYIITQNSFISIKLTDNAFEDEYIYNMLEKKIFASVNSHDF